MDVHHYIDSHIYRLLKKCSEERTVSGLCCAIASEIERLIPYDQARVLFLDENGKITSSVLYGTEKKNWKKFMEHYEQDSYGSLYSLKSPVQISEKELIHLCDWTTMDRKTKQADFYQSYVKPLRLKYCLGIGFTDQNGCLRGIISLDRTRSVPYEAEDIELLRYLYPILNGLHMNLYTYPVQTVEQDEILTEQYGLTTREKEIVDMIVRGVSTESISTRLCLSKNTVYKHLANIYRKTGVSNRGELQYMLHR